MSDDPIILTPEEAESLLVDGDTIHNFMQASIMLVGCDYDRAEAIAAIKAATSLEIGGDQCKSLNHALVCHEANGRYSFFETDPARVEAMEAAKAPAA